MSPSGHGRESTARPAALVVDQSHATRPFVERQVDDLLAHRDNAKSRSDDRMRSRGPDIGKPAGLARLEGGKWRSHGTENRWAANGGPRGIRFAVEHELQQDPHLSSLYRCDVTNVFGQGQYQVRFDWGIQGADAISAGADVIVVVDVLSFCTTVELAATLGVEVVPCAPEDASGVASRFGAVLVGARGVGASLSPVSITAESVAGIDRIAVASPNGSRLSAALGEQPALVVAGSLRNAAAVARWALDQQGGKGDRFTVAVVGAGEARQDGTLRFALEDLLGAGAIIDALAEVGIDYCSPEAAAAAAAYTALRNATGHLVGASASGRELIDRGFRADIDLAIALNASGTVPVLREFVFRAEC